MDSLEFEFDFESDDSVSCVLCNEAFDVIKDSQIFLQHLLHSHHFVIGSVEEVADLRQYTKYWNKLKSCNLKDFCVVWMTNSEPGAKYSSDMFYLLCDKLPEDKRLRSTIRQQKIKFLTDLKEKERCDLTFSRKCIYCSKIVTDGVNNCFSHLTYEHNITLGNPDNIIFCAKFLDVLEEHLQNLQCLYCEKKFDNHVTMREHMRKKQHKKLNPKNKTYDQFYLLNYLKPGTSWEEAKQDLEKESESSMSVIEKEHSRRFNEDHLWTDWKEDNHATSLCLFCNYVSSSGPEEVFNHMTNHHRFDFKSIARHMTFYQKVKIINFIRHKVSSHKCSLCDSSFNSKDSLNIHMTSLNHFVLPQQYSWDQARYLAPKLENDELLCCLEDNDDLSFNNANSTDVKVHPEDQICVTTSILTDTSIRDEILQPESCPLDFPSMCLFCPYTARGANAQSRLFTHMNTLHCFDFLGVTAILPFYSQVKLINYIRLCTSKGECYYCGQRFLTTATIEEHRVNESHNSLPNEYLFLDAKWLQPVLEEDGLLQNLRDNEDSDDELLKSPHSTEVIAEDIIIPPSILDDPELRREIMEEIHVNLQYNSD